MISAQVYDQALGAALHPVATLMADATVSEILINGPERVYVERAGRLQTTDVRFTYAQLERAVACIAQYQGVHVDGHSPILEARLPDGSRVEAILPPAGSGGPHVAIRRFARETLSIARLVALGSLSKLAGEALHALVAGKRNLVVAGGTGSGKTSLLNALSAFVPAGERVVVIEDARELQLQREHVVQLEAQRPDHRGRGRVTTRELFTATLRMRPDRIVLGEIRGGEALELLQAMTSGHAGCMTTVHATYPSDTLHRLETMALMSDVALPLPALRAQIASAIDILVQTTRLNSGDRVVTHITELVDYDGRDYALHDLFVREGAGAAGPGRLQPTGRIPRCAQGLAAMGMRWPTTASVGSEGPEGPEGRHGQG